MILKYKPDLPQCGLWLKTRKELIKLAKELRDNKQ